MEFDRMTGLTTQNQLLKLTSDIESIGLILGKNLNVVKYEMKCTPFTSKRVRIQLSPNDQLLDSVVRENPTVSATFLKNNNLVIYPGRWNGDSLEGFSGYVDISLRYIITTAEQFIAKLKENIQKNGLENTQKSLGFMVEIRKMLDI